jgi:hypothetical protein
MKIRQKSTSQTFVNYTVLAAVLEFDGTPHIVYNGESSSTDIKSYALWYGHKSAVIVTSPVDGSKIKCTTRLNKEFVLYLEPYCPHLALNF